MSGTSSGSGHLLSRWFKRDFRRAHYGSVPQSSGEELRRSEPQHELGDFSFVWSGRSCLGNRIHQVVIEAMSEDEAVIDKHVAQLAALLLQDPNAVSSRFTYQTTFNGVSQSGSGEAIHLAASRGPLKIIKVLLERKALLTSRVNRDEKPHYDVLHAAIFAEGRGGDQHIVTYLLEQNAPLENNLDNKSVLHLAFQTGQAELIPLLREKMRAKGILRAAESPEFPEPGSETPLQVGVHMRKLSEEQLSQVADLTSESLVVFINEEPNAIPTFLERYRQAKGLDPASRDLSKLLTMTHLANVLMESPKAADALITAVTTKPECTNNGWHPVPTRMSFASRNTAEKLQALLNPPRTCLEVYRKEEKWEFNMTDFKAPAWHGEFLGQNCGRPIRDVHIRVCHVPNLACPEFFYSLCTGTGEDHLNIFQNSTIRSLIQFVWWNGAVNVDVTQLVLSVWGLALLVVETYWLKSKGEGLLVAKSFIASRAVMDFGHEVVQFIGLIKIGRARSYSDLGNVYDLARCVVPIMLFFHSTNVFIIVTVIIMYWVRILEVNFSESISAELLPITRIARGLLPAGTVALIGFCALTHSLFIMDTGENLKENGLVLNSFEMLIGGNIPDDLKKDADESRGLLLFTYIAILAFTTFFLNIFIGVIGEQYGIHKGRCSLVFQELRAKICFTYLLRASVIPNGLCPKCLAQVAQVVCGLVTMVLPLIMLSRIHVPNSGIIFSGCFSIMILSCYQDPSLPWALSCSGSPREPYYLWLAESFTRKPAAPQ